MSAPAVSIGIPCWKRADFLRRTLETIRSQNYPGEVEIVIAEDDFDGGRIQRVAEDFGARYVQRQRTENYPPFQSVSKIWNLAFHNCSNEIVILQTDDILHEGRNVIDRTVWHLVNHPNCVAMPLVKALLPDGSFSEWFNHPSEHGEGNHLSGTGPFCMWKKDFERVGGYEELFYGYGYEDNYMHWLVRQNGLEFEYVMDAVCAHPSHERWKYEPITGFANRALIRTLIMEVEDKKRPPTANAMPLAIDLRARDEDVDAIVGQVREWPRGKSDVFENWLTRCWRHDKNPDHCAEGHRGVACDRSYPFWMMDEMIIEAAWGLIRAKMGREVAAFEPEWSAISNRAADITHTWGSRALAKAHELRKQW